MSINGVGPSAQGVRDRDAGIYRERRDSSFPGDRLADSDGGYRQAVANRVLSSLQ